MTKTKILVVDDQIDVAESIKNTLEHLGYAVPAIAYYGQEAIKLAGEMRPDLILMDIKLAGNLDGVEAAAAIQSRLDVPVVYLTAYADDQTLQRAQVTEPFGYILKPFTSRELHSAISIALYKHAIEHRLKKSEARYRAVVEDQTELISRYRPDYVLTFVNEAHCRYFSKTRQELLGHSFMPLLPEKDQERVAKHLATFSLQNPVGVIEHRAVLPGGEIRWQQWSDRAIFDDEGRLIEFQSVGRDITALKQAEKELHRRDGILQAVAFASEYLLRLADLDAGIPEALARLGAATGASRAYVFENHPGERSPLLASRWYEWLAPKVTSRLDSPRHQDIRPLAKVS